MRKKTGKQQAAQENYAFPKKVWDLHEQLKTATVGYHNLDNCDDYEYLGINANDILIINPSIAPTEEHLAVWDMVNTNFFNVGFHYDNFGDIVLHDGKGSYRRHKKKEVSLVGVVVGVIKPFDAQINAEAVGDSSDREPDEITLVCSNCKKEETGGKKFLIAQGWEIRNENHLCLICDLRKG